MQNLPFSWTTLGFATSILFSITACQPQSATSNESSETEQITPAEQSKQPSIAAPKPVTASTTAVDAKACLTLSDAMQKVDGESKIEAIYSVQQTLKACLPTANNAEVLTLLKEYEAMYGRFLSSDEALNEDYHSSFYRVMSAVDENERIPAADLKKLPPQVRYLITLVQDKADVSVQYLGEGHYNFSHDLSAMVDIFAPYLRPDQRAFIERMAQDNQNIFWNDAAVAITFDELIERAVFWEDYSKRYPDGYAVADAKSLLDYYRHTMFFGSDNTQWTDDAIREFIEPQYRQLMVKLARRSNSILAKDAQNFLNFLVMSDDERQEKYPAPLVDEDGYELTEWTTPRYQLDKAMSIPSLWDDSRKSERQCLNGVFCQDILYND